jgi:dsDNA-specific endonuclease/ATPase MutS2
VKRWLILLAAVLLIIPAASAQDAGKAAEEAKEKARAAVEAFTRAVQQMTVEASKRAQEAADALRGTVLDTVKRACDLGQQACMKACDGNDKCERACREGRAKCQTDN